MYRVCTPWTVRYSSVPCLYTMNRVMYGSRPKVCQGAGEVVCHLPPFVCLLLSAKLHMNELLRHSRRGPHSCLSSVIIMYLMSDPPVNVISVT